MGDTVQQGGQARGRERGERIREKAGSRKTSMGDMIKKKVEQLGANTSINTGQL
jgi:hypothetical protein